MSISVTIGQDLTSGIMLQWQLCDGGRAVNNTTCRVRKICILYYVTTCVFKSMQVLVLYNACSGSSYNSVYHLVISSVTSHKSLALRARLLWNIIHSPCGLVYNISVTDSGSMINPSWYDDPEQALYSTSICIDYNL
jgi:hypothetical protein